jgi:hypothetical protein
MVMPASRTFSYEYLKELVQQYPDWSHQEYAEVLTQEVRTRLGDPGHPRILPNTVAAALSRYRDTWLEQGARVPARRGTGRMIPWVGIPEAYRMDTKLRKLRTLAQIDAGVQVEPRLARLAEQFARGLREMRQVVDLTSGGRPVIRAARPDEVDGTGELLSLYARHPGLSEAQWESLTPDERKASSEHWLAPEYRDTPVGIS